MSVSAAWLVAVAAELDTNGLHVIHRAVGLSDHETGWFEADRETGGGHRVAMFAEPTAAPVRHLEPQVLERTQLDLPWDVIVWDDPVNLMSYVVFVLRRVFSFPEAMAHKLMLEVHNNGKALVASEPRERAEYHVEQLHGFGLHATMQRST